MTGRKSHKMKKGGNGLVWPPLIEHAFIEGRSLPCRTRSFAYHLTGLKNYRPKNTRAAILLGHNPGRNRAISDYILKETGEYRTPKQVSSRIQQLQGTVRRGTKSKCHL